MCKCLWFSPSTFAGKRGCKIVYGFSHNCIKLLSAAPLSAMITGPLAEGLFIKTLLLFHSFCTFLLLFHSFNDRRLIKPLLLSHSFYTLLSQLPTKMKANWQLILQQLKAQFVKRYPRTMEMAGNYISIYYFNQSCLTPDGPPSQSGRKVKTRELINQ